MHECDIIIYSDICLKTQLCPNSHNTADISVDTQNKTDLYQGGLRYLAVCYHFYVIEHSISFLQRGIISVLRCLSLNEAHYSVPPNHFMWIYHAPTCVNVKTDWYCTITKKVAGQAESCRDLLWCDNLQVLCSLCQIFILAFR